MNMANPPSRGQAHTLGALAVGLAMLSLVLFSVVGMGRTHGPGWDLGYFRVAGAIWLDGESPYAPEPFTSRIEKQSPNPEPDHFFAYPPSAAPAYMLLASWPEGWQWPVWTALNIIGILGLAWELASWLRRHDRGRGFLAQLGPWVVAAAVIGCPYTWDALWLGQPTPLLMWALIAGWRWIYEDKPWAGGALIGVALIKPPMLVLPLLWLLLQRQWRPLVAAGGVTLALAAYPMLLEGAITPWLGWVDQLGAYQTAPYNQYGSVKLYGLWSLIAALGGPQLGPAMAIAVLSVATVALWRFGPRRPPMETLALLVAVYPAFVYSHRYDMMFLLPAVAALWPVLRQRAWQVVVAGGLLFAIWLPERAVMVLGPVPNLLLHYRSVALPLFAGGMVLLSLTRDRRFVDPLETRAASPTPAPQPAGT
jgi:hypothetical protein